MAACTTGFTLWLSVADFCGDDSGAVHATVQKVPGYLLLEGASVHLQILNLSFNLSLISGNQHASQFARCTNSHERLHLQALMRMCALCWHTFDTIYTSEMGSLRGFCAATNSKKLHSACTTMTAITQDARMSSRDERGRKPSVWLARWFFCTTCQMPLTRSQKDWHFPFKLFAHVP